MHRGLLGTDDVERAFFQSDDFYTDNQRDAWTFITALHNRLLGRTRAPDEGGVANWAAFDLGFGDAATRTGLTGSDEYYQLAATR